MKEEESVCVDLITSLRSQMLKSGGSDLLFSTEQARECESQWLGVHHRLLMASVRSDTHRQREDREGGNIYLVCIIFLDRH